MLNPVLIKLPGAKMKRTTVARKALRIIAYLFGLFIFLLILVAIVFSIYRDEIGEKLLLRVNNMQKGTISFSDITFSPFVHFPDLSVKLTNVYYVYHHNGHSIQKPDTIAALGNLYIAADAKNLFGGKIVLSKITLSDGTLSLVQYPDSTINLIQALNVNNRDGPTGELDSPVRKDSKEAVEMAVRSIAISDFDIQYLQPGTQEKFRFGIDQLEASLAYNVGGLSSDLDVEALVEAPGILKNWEYGLPINVSTSFHFNQELGHLTIEPSVLMVRSAIFKFDGDVSFSDQVTIDLSLNAEDADMSFFESWLTSDGLKNLKSGETFFSGTISGMLGDQIPEMDFAFGMRNVELYIPQVGRSITGLGLEGNFNSGIQPDFSAASLVVRDISGYLPGGHINGNLALNDFTMPSISMFWDIEADVSGFDDVFNVPVISDLEGRISFFEKADGVYNLKTKAWMSVENESLLQLDSVSLNVAGFGAFRDITGRITRSVDTLVIEDLNFVSGKSDFRINGEVFNLLSAFTKKNDQITASLEVISDTLDLPVFLSFDPRIGRGFPYRITGIELEVDAITSRDKLQRYESNPEIDFGIGYLRATIEKLFPEIIIEKGTMRLAEKEARTYLTFNDFSIAVAGGQIESDVVFWSRPEDPDQVTVDADVRGLDPASMFFSGMDDIPPIAQGSLTTTVHSQLDLNRDSIDFDFVSLVVETLQYFSEKDTIEVAGLGLEAQEVTYMDRNNPLRDMSGVLKINAREVKTNRFHVEDVAYSIDVDQGKYVVYPEKVQFFGKEGNGIYQLQPFSSQPSYSIKYEVIEFNVETLLQRILKDTLLTGPMDIDMELSFSGRGNRELLTNLNGNMNLYGKDMTIYGIDLDNVIRKYQKSQKFSLVDVGAVALAGPIGLAVTKGTQFAGLAIGNYGESTEVKEMVSQWLFTNGRITLQDVAFTTSSNLIAGKGWIDLGSDSLEVTIAVLDRNRCRIVSQTIFGNLDNPQHSEVNIVGTLLGPVTNLLDISRDTDCTPFYTGRLRHPLVDNQNDKP